MTPTTDHNHGFPVDTWLTGKAEARAILVHCARKEQPITYSRFCEKIGAISFEPHGVHLRMLLEELSVEEHRAGRPLLSALVVYKETGMPGDGFYSLAHGLDYEFTDKLAFWVEQVAALKTAHTP